MTKKVVVTEAANAPASEGIALIDENLLRSKIHTIRGVKVMLDADLAEIYGYSTKAFNQQVKNNIDRFEEDFRFQLDRNDLEICSRSKILTLKGGNQGTNLKYRPYAFTEQGVYMLMTVLKGEMAIQQSKALIRLFKQMKDHIAAENQQLLGCANCAQIATITAQNTKEIALMRSDYEVLKVESQQNREKLNIVMNCFTEIPPSDHYLIMDGQCVKADVAYTQIYSSAKKSVIVADDYVDIKTLELLQCVAPNARVRIISDQKGKSRLTNSVLADFRRARPDVVLDVVESQNRFHDRYILIDYRTDDERLVHCGASSKDAGKKVTTISQIEHIALYRPLFDEFWPGRP